MSQVMEPLTKRPANAQAATSSFWETRFAPFCEKYFLLLCICLIGIACVRVISTYDALSLTPDEPTHFACGLQFVAQPRSTALKCSSTLPLSARCKR